MAQLPLVKCQYCDGKKRDKLGQTCAFCRGTGYVRLTSPVVTVTEKANEEIADALDKIERWGAPLTNTTTEVTK